MWMHFVEVPAFRPALRRKYKWALAPEPAPLNLKGFDRFDIGHARQVDPTMSEASAILRRFRDRIGQLHVSEVNTESRHDRLSLESILAFQKVCHLVPPDVPMILESRVDEAEINEEIRSALAALNQAGQLAVAGD